jgi:hypothetical protein
VIGVLARAGEAAAAEEFFELFKTPWEFYVPGHRYDVLLTTTGEIPLGCEPPIPLVIVSTGQGTTADALCGFVARTSLRGGSCEGQGWRVPIYGRLLTFDRAAAGVPSLESAAGIVGLRLPWGKSIVRRIGYDLLEEVQFLLATGQPPENAGVPALDIHIAMLRDWILEAGLPLIEIPPAPAGHPFCACLTHDIDFIGIRQHLLDHSMWGFLYRSFVGGLRSFVGRRIGFGRLLAMWRAALALPLVYAGWLADYWEPFAWYLRAERGLPATYFLLPFKRRPGERVPGSAGVRRAANYDVTDIPQAIATLQAADCEIGVHGIDAWHSIVKGREELTRVSNAIGGSGHDIGIRMHWLLHDDRTWSVLEQAGYSYDATGGYNETIGYRNGTTQVFRPLGATSLLELPLQIQDGALFYPQRLNLSEDEAATKCDGLIADTARHGGVVTVLWHDRSHGPERFWGDFYIRLLERLRARKPWFGTGGHIVGWFRQRRAIRFVRFDRADGRGVRLCYDGEEIRPPMVVRVHRPTLSKPSSTCVDRLWKGAAHLEWIRPTGSGPVAMEAPP